MKKARQLGSASIAIALLFLANPYAAAHAVSPLANTEIPAAAVAGDPAASEQTPTPTDSFGACVAGGGSADVMLLIDESGSLRQSDPTFARVTSATYFISQLAKFTATTSAQLDVQINAFGDKYEKVLGWVPLGPTTEPTIRASIATFTTRTAGQDTDYWTALNSARADLANKAALRTTTSCQALVWFTDGAIDFEIRSSKNQQAKYGTEKIFAPGILLTTAAGVQAAAQKAKEDLCRDGGIADQLRAAQITMFGVGLDGSTSKSSDFDFIQSVVTGRNSGSTCGKLIDPVPGEFFLATDIDSLLFAFDAIGSPGSRPKLQEKGICQAVACADQGHKFVLDASTPDVAILASADAAQLAASLQIPSGTLISLPNPGVGVPKTADAGGATVEYIWLSDKTVSVTMAAALSQAWTGVWQLAFIDPTGTSGGKKSHTNIHITGALVPKLLGTLAPLHSGELVKNLTFALVDRAGKNVSATDLLGTLRYTATFQDSAGREQTLIDTADKKQVGISTQIDLASTPVGHGLISLRLAITTASATNLDGTTEPGTALEPVSVAIPVDILAPLRYPVTGSSINFGTITGEANATGTLTLAGTGCAWIAEKTGTKVLASPDGIGVAAVSATTASSRASCIRAGNNRTMSVTLTTDRAGNGAIRGTVTVMLAPAGKDGAALAVQVPFTASMLKPLNGTSFWVTLVAAVLLGVGIPVLFLYILKFAVSKIPSQSLTGAVIDITVEGNRVLRAGSPFAFTPADTQRPIAIAQRGARKLEINDIKLTIKLGFSPGGAGRVAIIAPGRSSASDASPSIDRSGLRALLPLAIRNHWVVLHVPGAPPTSAEVLVILAGEASVSQKNDLAAEISRTLPVLLSELVEREHSTAKARGSATHGTAVAEDQALFSVTEPRAADAPWAPRT